MIVNFSGQPNGQTYYDWHTENKSLIWTGICKDCHTDAHDENIALAPKGFDSRKRSKNERAAECCYRASPVTVRPIAEHSQSKYCKNAAKQSPFRRHPRLKHPANS